MGNSFSSLGLSVSMLATLERIDYQQMTPIQEQVIPLVLEGADIIAKAKTGSGKTAAFGIGIIESIDTASTNLQAMIITPTRELAEQIAQSLRTLAQHKENTRIVTLYGGVPLTPQAKTLEKGAHIIVGTPGRIEDHLGKGSLKLSSVRTVVLDEADRMLDMGFAKNVEKILSNTSGQRQTLLFSATFPPDIASLSQRVQKDPVEVFLEEERVSSQIEEYFFDASGDKLPLLASLINAIGNSSTIIFCNTKEQCHRVADFLAKRHFVLKELHGELDQNRRSEVLMMFSNKSIPLLVATDIAARGLDIKEVSDIINMDFPTTPEIYLHRIGRTGRMDREGKAYSLVDAKEHHAFKSLQSSMKRDLSLQKFDPASFKPAAKERRMQTILLYAGKKKKLRKGDIIGALCNEGGLSAESIGAITIAEDLSYVAVSQSESQKAISFLAKGTVKKLRVKAKLLS